MKERNSKTSFKSLSKLRPCWYSTDQHSLYILSKTTKKLYIYIAIYIYKYNIYKGIYKQTYITSINQLKAKMSIL
jgi:hypothetical protein